MRPLDDVSVAGQHLKARFVADPPELAIVLGSGLAGDPADMQVDFSFPLADLPGFPAIRTAGHVARLSAGRLYDRRVLIFHGRYHLYEGYDAWQVTAPVRLAAAAGCRNILLTNAAGGIAAGMVAGDFMLVTDHLNLTGYNPLIGREEARFVDLSQVYCSTYYHQLCAGLAGTQIRLHRGVLAWMTGPSYETPAEISFLEKAGAAAVSMSTIPEAIVARRYGLKISALSLIANPAAGKGKKILDHADVLMTGVASRDKFHRLLQLLLLQWR